jgi:transcriptional regulator with PAS, ATPase and Fis domain
LNCRRHSDRVTGKRLFGYERGAFTGALSQKIGRFEMAQRGTLFLDEVGDIPLDLQPKLLRALQKKSFERLGGTKTIPIDVRLVAATNRDMTKIMGDQTLPQRPVLPVEGVPHCYAAVARSVRRHSPARPAFHQQVRGENGPDNR